MKFDITGSELAALAQYLKVWARPLIIQGEELITLAKGSPGVGK